MWIKFNLASVALKFMKGKWTVLFINLACIYCYYTDLLSSTTSSSSSWSSSSSLNQLSLNASDSEYTVHNNNYEIQWNHWIKDTLEPAILSTIERLSPSHRSIILLWEMIILEMFFLERLSSSQRVLYRSLAALSVLLSTLVSMYQEYETMTDQNMKTHIILNQKGKKYSPAKGHVPIIHTHARTHTCTHTHAHAHTHTHTHTHAHSIVSYYYWQEV